MRTAICPGSFDPITVGHLDMVERAARLFDQVIVCVMVNAEKHPMFPLDARLAMVRGAVEHLPNVRSAACDGLLADFAAQNGACALVKGVRSGGDFDWEFQMAQINRNLCPGLETLLLPARAEQLHISSTMVREMLRYGQNLDAYIPAGAAVILERLGEYYGK